LSEFLSQFPADLPNIAGLLGAVAVITAFFLNQAGKLASDTVLFSGTNLVGSVVIIWSLMHHFNAAAMLMEVCWALASALGLLRIWRRKRQMAP
jgi:NAD/NADP transhydrogenase alpha subunit